MGFTSTTPVVTDAWRFGVHLSRSVFLGHSRTPSFMYQRIKLSNEFIVAKIRRTFMFTQAPLLKLTELRDERRYKKVNLSYNK